MSVLSDNYKRIVSELEAKITNPEDLEFVKEKISELSVVFMDIIENITDKADQKMKKIEEKQRLIEAKIEEVQNSVDEIESDIYVEEDGSFDLIRRAETPADYFATFDFLINQRACEVPLGK